MRHRHLLLTFVLVGLAARELRAQSPLTVISAQPAGEIASLAQANEIPDAQGRDASASIVVK